MSIDIYAKIMLISSYLVTFHFNQEEVQREAVAATDG